MADIVYTVNQDLPENITGFEQYSQEDKALVSSFQINSTFDPTKHYSELHILSLSDELLESTYTYNSYTLLGNAQSAGQAGTSILTIDPIQDSKAYGYENAGIKLLYHFLDDLYSEDLSTVEFYIKSISPDRTELSLSTLNLTPEVVATITSNIKANLQNQSYFTGFRLNFKNNDLFIATNIDTLGTDTEQVVVVKLYEPLPTTYSTKSTLSIVDIVSDSVVYEVDSQTIEVPEVPPTLRSANFNIEIADDSVIPTQYYNYNELFSYPINNANSEIFSTVNEKGISINVDYSDFNDFVHFSSAQERLLNFKYKLDLVASYSSSISENSNATIGLEGVLGTTTYYEGLITGIVSNFDHYERFLYYESGSSCWPKSNTTKPHINKPSSNSESITWYTGQISKAIEYDLANNSSLAYSIPTYLRDDTNNENYLTFVYMIGQHFDNLWLYSKAVTDKYDADNRINYGISKDLVAEALRNFGVKLYTSNKSVEDLFTTFIGQAYQSGSEKISTYITGSLTGSNTPIQPTSYDNYQKEIQKRIYHNLPLLLKSKGTERGLRALINCYGIPANTLDIKLYGGTNQTNLPFFANTQYVTSSLDKIRLDNTGSVIDGNTLSNFTSIAKVDQKYTNDLHTIEVGFSPTDNIDQYIISQSSATFNIDQYLGDPTNITSGSYSGLDTAAQQILQSLEQYDLQDYVRLIKFFDNTIFKTIKDFIPARAVATTGVIIKPNLLNRSKAKSVAVSATQPEYTASIDTAFISGSDGGAFESTTAIGGHYDTSWINFIQTPQGLGQDTRNQGTRLPEYTGELGQSNITVSTVNLNINNSFKIQNPIPIANQQVRLIKDFPSNICGITPNYGTFIVTRDDTAPFTYNNYSIRQRFSIPGDATATYQIYSGSETPVIITSTASTYDFNKNYTTYIVSASKPTPAGCTGSAKFKTEFCDIVRLSNPSTVQYDTQVQLNTFFTTGSNTNTQYYTVINNIESPINTPYNFTQSIGTSLQVRLKDNSIASCQQQTTNIVIVSQPTPNGTTLSGNFVNQYGEFELQSIDAVAEATMTLGASGNFGTLNLSLYVNENPDRAQAYYRIYSGGTLLYTLTPILRSNGTPSVTAAYLDLNTLNGLVAEEEYTIQLSIVATYMKSFIAPTAIVSIGPSI